MRKILFSVVISFLCLSSLSAQTFVKKINLSPSQKVSPASTVGPLKILAVMVEFQKDKDETTYGDGTFGSIYSQDYGKKILDPLPFDQNFFASHLEFVKNYYKKVSGNKLDVSYTILPQIVKVSKTIRNYSPAPGSTDFTGLGDFSKEVWARADTANPGFDFSAYDVFVIFHAGVGRDVTTSSSLGNERDIPSVYLGLNGLQKIYGSSFNGFTLSDGKTKIKNSMIIPCTDNREETSLGVTYLFQISTNGLLVASLGSYLGLPDLYDTKTGLSAIGRFGLMDGQAIFTYSGAFPPELSAWEKMYLGWITPVTLSPGNYNIDLVTKIAATVSDTTVLKIPINSSEYFLVENRNRDANKDGAKVTYISDGVTHTKTFANDTTGFYSYSADSLYGVITDVDEFDWAIPGNGIVIWHIDENVINEKFASNTINANSERRGVAVEEADGIKEIGVSYTDALGDKLVGEGSAYDFWFSSNGAKLYKNKFDKDTRPNSNSNSGANSLISLSNFSNISNKMSFNVTYGDSVIKPILAVKNLNLSATNNKISYCGDDKTGKLIILSDSTLYSVGLSGDDFSSYSAASNYKPAILVEGSNKYIVCAKNTGKNSAVLTIILTSDNNSYTKYSAVSDEFTTAPVLIKNSDNTYSVLASSTSGKLHVFSLPSNSTEEISHYTLDFSFTQPIIKTVCTPTLGHTFLSSNWWFSNFSGKKFTGFDNAIDLTTFTDTKGACISAVLDKNKAVDVLDLDANKIASFSLSNADSLLTSLSAGNLKNDGENYIVFNNGNKIEAINEAGARATNFPFTDTSTVVFKGNPLIVDFEGDKNSEIISVTNDGRIFAVDGGTGKLVTGFPISTGAANISNPVIFNYNGKSVLAVIAAQTLYAWEIGSVAGTLYWNEENGNNFNNSFQTSASKTNTITSFFPQERAYNYPNPAYDNYTNIRYYVSEDSKINIKIFDISGDFVAELNNNAIGGMDNETVWKLNSIQSGIYLARIEATGVSGKTEKKVIKIAVVK